MDRPLTRPSKPYTLEEIFAAMVSHFIYEVAPQCIASICCKYSDTGCARGCAVGFMLTKEDAETWDGKNDGTTRFSSNTIRTIRKNRPHEYAVYFGEDGQVFRLLRAGQRLHDDVRGLTPEHFTDHMTSGLRALEHCFFE